jgi:hypothetical protein
MKKATTTTKTLAEIERTLAAQDRSLQAAYRGLAQKEASAIALRVDVVARFEHACSAAGAHRVEPRGAQGIRC